MESEASTKIEISQAIDQQGLSALQIVVMVMSALVVWLDGYHIQSMALVVPAPAGNRAGSDWTGIIGLYRARDPSNPCQSCFPL